jgi:hypothetical protein
MGDNASFQQSQKADLFTMMQPAGTISQIQSDRQFRLRKIPALLRHCGAKPSSLPVSLFTVP